jgi:uncharacterized protein
MQRIHSLDLLRGIAVLGILLINMISMGLPMTARSNPTAYGDFSGIHQLSWWFTHLFADQKFLPLFAVLFGAGILLFTEQAQQREWPQRRLHYKRMGWLLIFGLLHAWLLWYGDILFTYAVAGSLVFLMRKMRPFWLVAWSLAFVSIPFFLTLSVGAMALEWSGTQLQHMAHYWSPPAAELSAEINAMRGSFMDRLVERRELIISSQSDSLFYGSLWLAAGYMLLGMALYKTGVLTAQRSQAVYRGLALLLLPGLALVGYGALQMFAHDFSIRESMFFDSQWNYVASIPMVLAYVGLFTLWYRSNLATSLKRRLQAVGRMAFTNYIMHSILGVIIFNWLGYFGQLERFELLLLTLAVWILQLWLSSWYLHRFGQGPLEGLWRRLTYGKRSAAKQLHS